MIVNISGGACIILAWHFIYISYMTDKAVKDKKAWPEKEEKKQKDNKYENKK